MTYARACAVSEVEPDCPYAATVAGTDVAVVNTDGDWFAIYDECSHAAVPLSEGEVDQCHIECWMHGSRFNLRTGWPDQLPATLPVPIYPIRIEGDDVLIDVDNPIEQETKND